MFSALGSIRHQPAFRPRHRTGRGGRNTDGGHIGSAEREVMAIDAEAKKAAAMVARLVSFAAAEQEARPVSITALLRTLRPDGARLAKDLTTALTVKDAAHYGSVFVSATVLKSTLRAATRLVEAAETAVAT